ncbi:MAG: shikimate dehydrogenase [Thermodesulfobacteriota bacterium]
MIPDSHTEVYAIIGQPVGHSLSPAMHNAAFRALGLNKLYVALAVRDLAPAVAGLRALGFAGVSVTVPHKQAILPLCDQLEPVAARIGAVNTLCLEAGRILGANTDWLGANRALAEVTALAGKRFCLLGSGGAARAVGFGLRAAGAQVVLASRSRERGEDLARQLEAEWCPLGQVGSLAADGLVNATSVGMAPRQEESPVPAALLDRFPVVMDIVYAPRQTRLLAEAGRAGCRTVDGLGMLLYQGVAQFELWTGLAAPVAVMRQALEDGLAARAAGV